MDDARHFHPNNFNSGLLSCTDDRDSCLDGAFCPWCQISTQYNMFQNREMGNLPHIFIPLFVLDYVSGGLVLSCVSVMMRNRARRTFSLEETDMDSCCKAFCCSQCSICQVYREMSIRRHWPGGVCVGKRYVKEGLVVPPSIQQLGRPGGEATHSLDDARYEHQGGDQDMQPIVYGFPMATTDTSNVAYSERSSDRHRQDNVPPPAVVEVHHQDATAPPREYPVYGFEGGRPIAGPKSV
ncbi:ama1 protein, putative [Bodo saltans]|uniref:Ama1 protein, putative n=1 Tax=Bodo saltans TaxID=75058 RepID=A0A0S4J4B1_BODSA|nr:ama1 protein, putative [Bodo saltans]|eukprot:CUG15342.1 ama1 protein, putative [Bodo saltans]